ncbi:MarR family transcriptional regulator [Sphingomonas populi]|uniref:MarR family transcriptional regulator n=2 Tax=Sphingomonas populi TaxID=2484750 RepID=A0A4V2DC79_9SPHN|nr:MarR family transcriptional regulator [Sphingomonas populi]
MSNDDFNRNAGSSTLGARLRRLSEQIDRDATRVYAARGIVFEQRWFGPLNQIVQNGPMAIGEIAEKLRITHVSVSQAARSLEAAGLIASYADAADGRRRLLALTSEGQARVRELAPIWAAFDTAATALDEEAGSVVPALNRLDDALADLSLFDRVSELLDRPGISNR